MTTPHLPYPLDLGDGREPILCRDAHQASLLLGIWRAWCGTQNTTTNAASHEAGARSASNTRPQDGVVVLVE
jgi:hypothetical protein